ncbi:unnamed protein product [Parascedosporium putredinis]|uniref:chitinase n=1 Tax=Parascedosporium putredinis TaxID=1442378 RepID=A0A9P1GVX9_9PEZI|nr:unnamed protein product [Parascedosporium putredinis]CAI7988311.1 unnamed protein product [Parascedosporium putredinis]
MFSLRKVCLSALVALSAVTSVSAQSPAGSWEIKPGPVTYDPELGAAFTVSKALDSPTLRTKFYFFFGRVEMMLKVASGQGIISSMMWLSDNLDEVDWEFFGTNGTYAATNYFGKGEEDFTNGGYHEVPFDVRDDYHNYTTEWTRDRLDWYIDGRLVRTLLPKDANNTRNYPQTPMRLSLGIWAGGDSSMPQGVREWAGGDTDYSKGPYTMWVKSVKVTDYTPDSKQYIFGDRSGSMDSIQIVDGNSTVRELLFKEPEKTVAEKWEELPQTAKTAVYASGAGVGAVVFAFGLWFCIKQRRRGAAEAAAAEAAAAQERLEMQNFKARGVNPDSFSGGASDWTVAEVHDGGVVQEKKGGFSVEERAIPSPQRRHLQRGQQFDDNWNGRAGPYRPRSRPRPAACMPCLCSTMDPEALHWPAPEPLALRLSELSAPALRTQRDDPNAYSGGYSGGGVGYGEFDGPRAQSPAHVMPPPRSGSAAPTYGGAYGAPQSPVYGQQQQQQQGGGYWNNNGPGAYR